MSTYRSFVFVGVGQLGGLILDALLSKGSSSISITVLTRPGSEKKFPADIKVIPVDYSNVPAVAALLKKHDADVVVSTVGAQAVRSQWPVAEAAKAAGVKLFIPSEFGFVTEGQPKGGSMDAKIEFGEYLRSIGLPFARIYNSLFTEGIPWMTAYDETGNFHIVGKGETAASYTSIEDVGGFVAHIITTLPPGSLHNAEFRLEGDRASLKQVAELWGAPSITNVERIPGQGSDFKTDLGHSFEIGYGSTGWDTSSQKDREEWAGSGNKYWEGHIWKTIENVHDL